MADVSPSQVAKIEKGDQEDFRDPEAWTRIAKAFGMTRVEWDLQTGQLTPEELNRIRGREDIEEYLLGDPNLDSAGRNAILSVYEVAVPGWRRKRQDGQS